MLFNDIEGLEVTLEYRLPLLNHLAITVKQTCGDAQGIFELEPNAGAGVQAGENILLQGGKARAFPQGAIGFVPPRVTRICLACKACLALTGKSCGSIPNSWRALVRTKSRTWLNSASFSKRSILLTMMTIFLPQAADPFEEGALAFAKGAVGAGDKEDQVAAGDKMFGQLLVTLDDGVGAWGVNQVESRAARVQGPG